MKGIFGAIVMAAWLGFMLCILLVTIRMAVPQLRRAISERAFARVLLIPCYVVLFNSPFLFILLALFNALGSGSSFDCPACPP